MFEETEQEHEARVSSENYTALAILVGYFVFVGFWIVTAVVGIH